MRIAISGSTGFIGSHVRRELERGNIEIVPLTRKDFETKQVLQKLQYCDGIIHLAGESIGGLWTKRKKERIYDSRVLTARMLVEACINLKDKIRFYISISGVGIYDRIHEHNERSTHFADHYLARVIRDWEGEARRLSKYDVKTVFIRTGIVLGSEGGSLSLFTLPYRLKIGFSLNNSDYFPVIHVEDLARIFHMAVTEKGMEGVYNAVTPYESSIQEFFRFLGSHFKPWFNLGLSNTLLRFFMGESSLLLTEGQHVKPDRLIEVNFEFKYPSADVAINKCLTR